MNKLIVLLGNPGKEYEDTRHNIGWLIVDKYKDFSSLNWKSKFKGLYAAMDTEEGKVYFLKPETYMNLSGESVKPLCSFFKVEAKDILVVHDELDLPLGVMMGKFGGGHAGHNGLKSIAEHMGTKDFYRIRVGIGRPQHGSVSDWVLSKFHGDDAILLEQVIEKAGRIVHDFSVFDYEKAFRKYGKKISIG